MKSENIRVLVIILTTLLIVLYFSVVYDVGLTNYSQSGETESQGTQTPIEVVSSKTLLDDSDVRQSPVMDDNYSSTDHLHWARMPLKYFIENEKECGSYESTKIKSAFAQVENDTDHQVIYKKINNSKEADITVNCSFIKDCYLISRWHDDNYYYVNETMCEHDLGRAQIVNEGNRIISAHIEFIGIYGYIEQNGLSKVSGFAIGNCGHLNVETHEILHTLGFDHSLDPDSIMFPREQSNVIFETYHKGDCQGSMRPIDPQIISTLKDIYSI